MVNALVLETSGETLAGSSPAMGTKSAHTRHAIYRELVGSIK